MSRIEAVNFHAQMRERMVQIGDAQSETFPIGSLSKKNRSFTLCIKVLGLCIQYNRPLRNRGTY